MLIVEWAIALVGPLFMAGLFVAAIVEWFEWDILAIMRTVVKALRPHKSRGTPARERDSLQTDRSSAPFLWTLRHPRKRWWMVRRGRALVQAYEQEKQAEWETVKPKEPSRFESVLSVTHLGAYVTSYGGQIPFDEKLFSTAESRQEFRVGQRVTRYWRGREVKDSGVIVGIEPEMEITTLGYPKYPPGTLLVRRDADPPGEKDAAWDPRDCRVENKPEFHRGQRITFPGGSGVIVGIAGENSLRYSDTVPTGTLWVTDNDPYNLMMVPKDPRDCHVESCESNPPTEMEGPI